MTDGTRMGGGQAHLLDAGGRVRLPAVIPTDHSRKLAEGGILKTFLAVVGALAILFILAVVAMVVWLRWKVGRMARQIVGTMENANGAAAKASSVPPFRISLWPFSTSEWDEPGEVEEIAAPLREAQFTEVGTFLVRPGSLRLAAFCHPRERAFAVVYEHPQAGRWVDLVSYYEDGSSITYTTSPDTMMDRPEKKPIHHLDGFGADELLRTFLRERPHKPLRPVSPQQFQENFERAYAEDMDWRIARGGPTEDEIRRSVERKGKQCTPELVQAVRGSWAAAIELFQLTEGGDRLIEDETSPPGEPA